MEVGKFFIEGLFICILLGRLLVWKECCERFLFGLFRVDQEGKFMNRDL